MIRKSLLSIGISIYSLLPQILGNGINIYSPFRIDEIPAKWAGGSIPPGEASKGVPSPSISPGGGILKGGALFQFDGFNGS